MAAEFVLTQVDDGRSLAALIVGQIPIRARICSPVMARSPSRRSHPASLPRQSWIASPKRAKKKQRTKVLIMLRGRCRSFFTSPEGRGRREAPGEGLRSIDGAKPLTRIAKAIRPLPAGEVHTARFIRAGRAKPGSELAMTKQKVSCKYIKSRASACCEISSAHDHQPLAAAENAATSESRVNRSARASMIT